MRSEGSGERHAARIAWLHPGGHIALLIAAICTSGAAFAQGSLQDLGKLSLQDLGQIVVTSVAKHPEMLADSLTDEDNSDSLSAA